LEDEADEEEDEEDSAGELNAAPVEAESAETWRTGRGSPRRQLTTFACQSRSNWEDQRTASSCAAASRRAP
jgi:hypothetical protein